MDVAAFLMLKLRKSVQKFPANDRLCILCLQVWQRMTEGLSNHPKVSSVWLQQYSMVLSLWDVTVSLYVKLSITMRTLLNWSNLASISLGNKSPFPVGGGPKSRNKSPGIKSPVIKSLENKSPSAKTLRRGGHANNHSSARIWKMQLRLLPAPWYGQPGTMLECKKKFVRPTSKGKVA